MEKDDSMEEDDAVREKIRKALLEMVMFGPENIFSGQEIQARLGAARLLLEYMDYRDDGVSNGTTKEVEEKLLNMVVEGRTGEQIADRVEAARLLLECYKAIGGESF